MAEPMGEIPGVNGDLSESVQPSETSQQYMERLRDETRKSIGIIAANMIDLDEQKVEPGMRAINLLRDLENDMSKLPEHPQIYDRLTIANDHELSGQLIAEINQKRAERGEPPAETIFDQSQVTEAKPITPNIDSIDMTQLGKNLAQSIVDLPREVTTEIDRSDTMWGRVNVLKHDDVVFGTANVDVVFDQNRERSIAHRDLYKDGRYAGRWDQEVNYYRDVSKGHNPPKKLISYEETVFDNANKPIEGIKAEFYADGRICIDNIHYANGEEKGTTQLTFSYDKDGNIVEMKQAELDPSGNQLSETIKDTPVTNEKPLVENSSPPIIQREEHQQESKTAINEQDYPVAPKKPNMLRKIGGFFGRK